MPRLRRVNRLCSSMVSGTADSSGHGSTLCSPTVEKILCRSPISERSPVSGLRQAKKQRETGVKRVETAGVYPLAHRRGYGESPAVRRRRTPPLRFSENSPPVRDEHAPRSSLAPVSQCRKTLPQKTGMRPRFPVRKKYPKTNKNATSGRAAAPPRRVS